MANVPDSGGFVYALTPDGAVLTVLHAFDTVTQGGYPSGVPLQGSDGRLYGQTFYGGPNNAGTVYTLETDGDGFSVLHHLVSAVEGRNALGSLVQRPDGRLYGGTQSGGVNAVGTLFRSNVDGTGFGVLHAFTSATVPDAIGPVGG